MIKFPEGMDGYRWGRMGVDIPSGAVVMWTIFLSLILQLMEFIGMDMLWSRVFPLGVLRGRRSYINKAHDIESFGGAWWAAEEWFSHL